MYSHVRHSFIKDLLSIFLWILRQKRFHIQEKAFWNMQDNELYTNHYFSLFCRKIKIDDLTLEKEADAEEVCHEIYRKKVW